MALLTREPGNSAIDRTMNKTLLHRLFGLGRVPKWYAPTVESEGLVLLDEGVGGWITLRDFGYRGRPWFASWKRRWFTGSLVATRRSFAAFAFWKRIAFAPRERFHELRCSIDGKGRLKVTFEATAFSDRWYGSVECRFNTTMASEFAAQLSSSSEVAGTAQSECQ